MLAGLVIVTNQQSVTRTYVLHKFMQPIGQETDTISFGPEGRTIDAKFKFVDRGSPVEHHAVLETSTSLEPKHLNLTGLIARGAKGNVDVLVDASGTATVRRDDATTRILVQKGACAIAGYAPVGFQENLLQTWMARGKPKNMAILPNGSVQIRLTAKDTFGSRTLDRYSVSGLVWGLETVWMDSKNQLAAVMTRDAEFDHFEAVAPEYKEFLPRFAGLAGQDATEELAKTISSLGMKQSKGTALVGGRLFDGQHVVENGYVLMQGDRITSCGPYIGKKKFPVGTQVIDVHGKTMMPGLWDMHAHYEQAEWGPCYLAAGVTTVRDCGNVFEFITEVRDALDHGQGVGPRLILAGLVDGDGPFSLGINRVNSADDAVSMVQKYKSAGFQQMKIYSSVKLDNVRAICEAAHKAGMTVTGHIPNGMTTRQGIEAGMDQINHINYLLAYMFEKDGEQPNSLKDVIAAMGTFDPNSSDSREKLRFLVDHKVVVDDTAALSELFMHNSSARASTFEPGITKVPTELSAPMNSMAAGGNANSAKLLEFTIRLIGILHKAGVPIIAGTDQAVPGHSLHRELELYVKAGMSPLEALQAATTVPAKAMKMDGRTGWIKPGYAADVIVIDGNPTKHIEDSRKVSMVFSQGRKYDPAKLWRAIGFTP